MSDDKLVWYASYGSNCFRERFHCYISGGKFKGNNNYHEGCRDKTSPMDEKNIVINHKLYFAKKSKSWDLGGVGFIGLHRNKDEQTFGRMYLITRSQFADVVKQETKSQALIDIDFDAAIENGQANVLNDSWYGNILYIGTEGNFPIFTFTNSANLSDYNKPSISYLKTIVKGVLVNYGMPKEKILHYLQSRPGIIHNYSENELMAIIRSCISEAELMMN